MGIAAFVLVGFLVSLVLLNFFFAQRVRGALMAQLQRETEKQALVLEHFFSERKDNLVEIARSRGLSVYFENKALGMSMEYGLRQSLPPIRENFQYYLERKHISSEPIFSRFVLVEKDGTVLVDTNAMADVTVTGNTFASYLNVEHREGTILLDNNERDIVVSVANFLKGSYAGQTVAWLNVNCLYRYLLSENGSGSSAGRWLLLAQERPSRAVGMQESSGFYLPPIKDFRGERIFEYSEPGDNRRIGVWAPIEGTGLVLLRLIGSDEMPGQIRPWQLLAGMSLLGVFILIGAAFSIRLFLRSRILGVQLEETIAREALAKEKSIQLELEIIERTRAQESFNILQFSMRDIELRSVMEKALTDLSGLSWLGIRDMSAVRILDPDGGDEKVIAIKGYAEASAGLSRYQGENYLDRSSGSASQLSLTKSDDPGHRALCEVQEPHSHYCVGLHHGPQRLGSLDLIVDHDYHPSDHAARFIASFADVLSLIVQRRRSDEALQIAHEANRILIDSIPLILITLDSQNRILRFNPTAEEWLQVKASSVVGRDITSCSLPWKFGSLAEMLRNLGSKARLEAPSDVRYSRRDRQEGFLSVTLCAVSDADSDAETKVLLLASDVTEQRLIESHMLLTQKLDAVGQLAGGIAHEINTPMQYIDDNLNFLRESYGLLLSYVRKVEEMAREYQPAEAQGRFQLLAEEARTDFLGEESLNALRDIESGVLHVSNIVSAMKEFSRADSGDKIKIDINKALRDTITVTRSEWRYVCEVETDFEHDIPGAYGVPGEINQVFLNIIVNAVHSISEVRGATPRRGLIRIATRRTGDMVEISIRDNGTGVPESIKDRIFDPFFTTKPIGKGMGQGLTIARNIVVQKHNGQLYCESEDSGGAVFVIKLPAAKLP